MTRHSTYRKWLAAPTGLSEDKRARLDRHVAECAACRSLEQQYAHQDAQLRSLLQPSPPVALINRVRVEARTRPRRFRSPVDTETAPVAGVFLTACLLIVAAFLHARHSTPRNEGQDAPVVPSSLPAKPYTVSGISHGLEITLVLPSNTFPRNALISAEVTVTNVSSAPIWLAQGANEIGVALVDETGHPFPLPTATPSGPKFAAERFGPLGHVVGGEGPNIPPKALNPGETVTRELYGVLASPYLQAGVSISSGYAVEVMGPIAEMQLTEAPAPRVELHTTGSVYAVVHESARSPIAGPLLYEPAGTSCKESAQGTEESFPGGIGWLETRRDQLNAVWPQGQSWHGQCTHDYEWHVIAGWVGMPVAHIDYSSATPPASLSTPTPLPSQASPDKSR